MFPTLVIEVRLRSQRTPRLLAALLSDIIESESHPEYLRALVAVYGGTPEEALAAHLKKRAQVVGWG